MRGLKSGFLFCFSGAIIHTHVRCAAERSLLLLAVRSCKSVIQARWSQPLFRLVGLDVVSGEEQLRECLNPRRTGGTRPGGITHLGRRCPARYPGRKPARRTQCSLRLAPLSPVATLLGQVPDGVRFCTVKTNAPADTDVGCIVLCPQNSEADFALALLKKVGILEECQLRNSRESTKQTMVQQQQRQPPKK